ncbi:DUF3592 domain-containing protein [Kistimonas asteriae]|uniref:DUF3592 domain-containing protein n=1 Tax=Kistimonas asteriae TaxID=517724 RepID=UPI001BABBF80|nr:DUF3592 domain-containing protein [Kistimonas asteriae]
MDSHEQEKSIDKLASVLAGLPGIVFFIIGVVTAYTLFFSDLYNAMTSPKWPTAQGQVIDVEEVVPTGYRKGFPYAKITYQYTVKNTQYQNHWIRFGYNKVHNGVRSDADAIRAAYPLGTLVTVYHHPDHPKQSVLKPGEFPWIDLTFLLIPGLCFFFAWRLR